jgi:hypothetical protein
MAVFANPITSAAPDGDPFTSTCQPYAPATFNGEIKSPRDSLYLDLRGRVFQIEWEEFIHLPKTVLSCLFPQGLMPCRTATRKEVDNGVFTIDVRHLTLDDGVFADRVFPECDRLL